MVRQCVHCTHQRAVLRRPKTAEPLCRDCFYAALEQEVHETITAARLFKPGERVAVAASGGKDSTVLAHMLTTLNARHGCVGWRLAGEQTGCRSLLTHSLRGSEERTSATVPCRALVTLFRPLQW